MASEQRFVGPVLSPVVSGPRPGRMRDRRARGLRGPQALPGPLSPDSIPTHLSRRQQFDRIVADIVVALDPQFAGESDEIAVVVEEAPLLPAEWDEPVPASVVVHQPAPARLILYRLPLTQACATDTELEELIWVTVLDGLAEMWQVAPESIDPRSVHHHRRPPGR